MSQPDTNGIARKPLEPIILPDGSRLLRCDEDDPDAIVQTWPNGDGPRSDLAFPPKSDEVRETRHQELMALVNAMTAYKRKRGLEYLLWHDVLGVLHDMGYRKVAPPAEAPAEPAPDAQTTNP
jgi:hypothetical protein